MRPKQVSEILIRALAGLAVTFTLTSAAWPAAKFKVLHAFQCDKNNACLPTAGLTFDPAGNLYGAAGAGVFRLTRTSRDRWNYAILHTLTYSEGYGLFAGVSLDPAGNVYGNGDAGGSHDSGTVFELMSGGSLSWPAIVLQNFNLYGQEGGDPFDGPILDKAGNLYGTTRDGGANGGGVAFELAPGAAGWTETVLYSFCPQNDCSGGAAP
jgi:uncharacterized repeat protein (TIGR03803 family)